MSAASTRLEVAADSLFGFDNLPYGVFSAAGGPRRVGVRVGDSVVDLAIVLDDDVFAQPSLNPFLARGYEAWADTRAALTHVLRGDLPAAAVHAVRDVSLHLPVEVGDYVDFYSSEHHASNLGRLFRPGSDPLPPNWKHLPVGYHGRSGTITVSGTPVIRPHGQTKAPDQELPSFGPTARLDIEAEVGFIVGTPSQPGVPIRVDDFSRYVFGVVLVNDWSARDIQAWEYVPLGPFLGKSFATSISPWVVPLAALEAARVDTPEQHPRPLPYLEPSESWGLDLELAVEWNGQHVSSPPYREMYWSPAQMLAHLTVNGATTRTGDLFASGTVSGPEVRQRGAFIELTWGGSQPIEVNGEPRTFVEDGDEIAISATAPGVNGGRIGFGEVRNRVVARPEGRAMGASGH